MLQFRGADTKGGVKKRKMQLVLIRCRTVGWLCKATYGSLGRAACREIIWCASFVHFQFNRQGNPIVNKMGYFVNLEKGNSRQRLSSICTLSDRLICYCPCDMMIFLKKLNSLPYTYFEILWLMTRKSPFFSLLSAEVNDMISSIAFTRF